MRTLLGLGSVSASLIAYQIVLMQILSLVQWDHFAYMILSVAMLGFGVAGTALSVYRNKLLAKSRFILPWLSLVTCILQFSSIGMLQWELVRFDSYLIFTNWSHLPGLLVNYLLFMLPMATGALVIGLIITQRASDIGKVYAANLVGSGAGAVLFLLISDHVMPQESAKIVSFVAFLGACFLLNDLGTIQKWSFGLTAAAALTFMAIAPIKLNPSQFKSISNTLTLPDARIEFTVPSQKGLLQAVRSKHLKYGPAIGLGHPGTLVASHMVFENGNSKGPVYKPPSSQVLSHSVFFLPWILGEHENVLIIDAGTAPMLLPSLEQGATKVCLVESNPKLSKLLQNELGDANDHIFNLPEVHIFDGHSRVYYEISPDLFDLIMLPTVNQLGGNSGVDALTPDFNLTREGLTALNNRLASQGLLSLNCWIDYPPKYPLRVLVTLIDFISSQGLVQPEEHIIAIRNWGAIGFAVRLTPFSDHEVQKVKEFCVANNFDPVVLAGNPIETNNVINQLQDNMLVEAIAQILKTNGNGIEEYPFKIEATSDDQPFFNQFVKLENLPSIIKSWSPGHLPFLEIGYALVLLSFVQVGLLALLLVIIPLILRGGNWSNKSWTFFYFSGIGVGYMMIELALIHTVTFFLGNPILASGITIGALLVWSGIGSYWSPHLGAGMKRWRFSLAFIVVLVIGYGFFLSNRLTDWLAYPEILKVIMLLLSLAPIGIALGIPFASGISFMSRNNRAAIPWAWAINSCFSVVAPVAATILAVQLGYQMLFLAAGVAYLLTFFSVTFLHPANSIHS